LTEVGHVASDEESQPDAAVDVPSFPFQLRDAFLLSCSITRRASLPDDPERPRFATAIRTEDQADLEGFLAHLTVETVFRFRDEATCELTACTTGVFLRTAPSEGDIEQRFRNADCAVILWPYARAVVAELVRMSGFKVPPLPTIDVRLTLTNLNSDQS
jgi:preprotein translocase subunit SecB